MLITNAEQLKNYFAAHRLWQGIPGIEVTPKGRIFSVFYSGGTGEMDGNFALLVKSDDGGESFSEPIAVAHRPEGRCYDPVLWIDPADHLWFIWSYASYKEEGGVFATVCNNPDAETLIWSDVFFLGKFVMMNKPTVLSTGQWLFPIAVWNPSQATVLPPVDSDKEETGAFVYQLTGNRQFAKLGGVQAPGRTYDEHMVLELADGTLQMLIRTAYGIAVSYSYDKGHTWSVAEDSHLGGPNSRFFIRRLKSGRVLLVNHYRYHGRNNITALLSEDDGKTWPYTLLLDERTNVAYPDGVEAADGYIYITYDRERGCLRKSMAEVMADAREILMAKITEADIMAGRLTDPGSKLKHIISKLDGYIDQDPYPTL